MDTNGGGAEAAASGRLSDKGKRKQDGGAGRRCTAPPPRRRGERDSPSVHEEVRDASVGDKGLFVLPQTLPNVERRQTQQIITPFSVLANTPRTKIHQHKLESSGQLPSGYKKQNMKS